MICSCILGAMGGPYPNSGGLVGLAVGLAFALVGVAVGGCASFAAAGCARGCGLMRGLGLLVGWMAILTVAG